MTHPHSRERSPLLHSHQSSSVSRDAIAAETTRIALSLKIAAAMLSFVTLGLFNSSIGAVLPLISSQYALTDLHVSFLFLAVPLGYILAAQSSDYIHYHFGQRGIALLGPSLQIIANVAIAIHPGFEWILVAFAVQGLGMGLLDGSWCAWAGSMPKANTISGLLHGSYSIGGAAGPFIVVLITTRNRPWWIWYYILVCHSLFPVQKFPTINGYRQSSHVSNPSS